MQDLKSLKQKALQMFYKEGNTFNTFVKSQI